MFDINKTDGVDLNSYPVKEICKVSTQQLLYIIMAWRHGDAHFMSARFNVYKMCHYIEVFSLVDICFFITKLNYYFTTISEYSVRPFYFLYSTIP